MNISSLQAKRERVYKFGTGHLTKMTAKPVYGKKLKNLLHNHWVDCLETWYIAFGNLVLQCLHICWPWVDLDLFYSKVTSGHLEFWMGNFWKKKNVFFSCHCCHCAFWYRITEIQPLWNSKGQSHLMTCAKGNFSTFNWYFHRAPCFSVTTGSISVKFHIQPSGKGEKKVYIFRQAPWPTWPPCLYMVKALIIVFSRTYKADCLEIWYVDFGL